MIEITPPSEPPHKREKAAGIKRKTPFEVDATQSAQDARAQDRMPPADAKQRHGVQRTGYKFQKTSPIVPCSHEDEKG